MRITDEQVDNLAWALSQVIKGENALSDKSTNTTYPKIFSINTIKDKAFTYKEVKKCITTS